MVYVTQKTDLIISSLKEKKRASSLEIINFAIENGIDAVEARLILADAVRKGIIRKVPDYDKKVEMFELK